MEFQEAPFPFDCFLIIKNMLFFETSLLKHNEQK